MYTSLFLLGIDWIIKMDGGGGREKGVFLRWIIMYR